MNTVERTATYQVQGSYFKATILVNSDGEIVETAPILRKFKGFGIATFLQIAGDHQWNVEFHEGE